LSKRKNVEKEDFKGTRDLAIANNTCLGIQHVKSGGAIHTLFKNGKRLGEYYE
tara:strand:- start:1074 stop:1232 length:159 start_codon:yes stop_codon:yes gene_type:complete